MAQEVERVVHSSEDRQFNSSSPHLKVSLDKIANPKLLPMTVPLLCEHVCAICGFVNVSACASECLCEIMCMCVCVCVVCIPTLACMYVMERYGQ